MGINEKNTLSNSTFLRGRSHGLLLSKAIFLRISELNPTDYRCGQAQTRNSRVQFGAEAIYNCENYFFGNEKNRISRLLHRWRIMPTDNTVYNIYFRIHLK
jgi:hypothetical protein